jgi:hypothetical protein
VNSFLPAFDLGDGYDLTDVLGLDSDGSINGPNGVTGRRKKSQGNTEMHIGNRMFEIRSTVTEQDKDEFKRGLVQDDVNIIIKKDI